MHTLNISRKAHKQLIKLPMPTQAAIDDALDSLTAWPDCRNVKALSGRKGYRLRVGNFRVLFQVEGQNIYVEEVKKRDEHTY